MKDGRTSQDGLGTLCGVSRAYLPWFGDRFLSSSDCIKGASCFRGRGVQSEKWDRQHCTKWCLATGI